MYPINDQNVTLVLREIRRQRKLAELREQAAYCRKQEEYWKGVTRDLEYTLKLHNELVEKQKEYNKLFGEALRKNKEMSDAVCVEEPNRDSYIKTLDFMQRNGAALTVIEIAESISMSESAVYNALFAGIKAKKIIKLDKNKFKIARSYAKTTPKTD